MTHYSLLFLTLAAVVIAGPGATSHVAPPASPDSSEAHAAHIPLATVPSVPLLSLPPRMRSDPDELIVDQPDAPLRITAYEADYDGVRLFRDDGIRHEVRFRSGIDRRIEAFRLVFVMFSLFNDSIGQERGVYLDAVPPNAFGNGTWNHDPPNAETFHVGAVYVEKVRYANGDVWSASESEVQTQLDQVGQRPLKKKDS